MKRILVIICPLLVLSCSSTKTRESSSLSTLPLNTCEAIGSLFDNELTHYEDIVDAANRDYQDEQWKVETADPKASPEKMSKLFEVVQEKSYDKKLLEQVLNIAKATEPLSVDACPIKEKLLRAKELLETSILTNDAVIKMEKENQ